MSLFQNCLDTASTIPVAIDTAPVPSITAPIIPVVNLPPGPRMVSGYGLRNRPKPVPSGKPGPSRISKSKVSFDGLFSSEESSQDSRLVTNADDDQYETAKLIKITGLSEPSPYRMAAQPLYNRTKARPFTSTAKSKLTRYQAKNQFQF